MSSSRRICGLLVGRSAERYGDYDHARKGRPADRMIDDHLTIARQHDLNPPARRRFQRDLVVRLRAYRRSSRLVAWYPRIRRPAAAPGVA